MLIEKKIAFLPLKVSLIFLVFSEVLVFIGPYTYDISNHFLLYSYLIVLNTALYLGYKRGVRQFKPSVFNFSQITLDVFLIVGFLLTFRRMYFMWSGRGLGLSLYSVLYALSNSGDVYKTKVEVAQVFSSTFWDLLSPFRWSAIPLGIGNWKRLNKSLRVIVVLTIIIEALAWLGIGTRKGLFDIIIITVFTLLSTNSQIILDTKKWKKTIIITSIAAVAFLFYFTISGASRRGYMVSELSTIDITQEIKPSYQNVPDGLLYSFCSIESYLCQGYYALSKGLGLGIQPVTFGGSGWYTIMLMRKIGYDPEPNTYIVAVERFGIDRHINWHSIYLWLANDVTFIGVPFLIFLIGYLFAISWLDIVNGKNQTAYPFFALMLIMVFYFYANNQVLSFTFIPFVFWLLFYGITRISSIKK